MTAQASSILGYGAIGLGFLLAVLAYRLLSTAHGNVNVKYGPIYIFELFCLALVLIGAALQYVEPKKTISDLTAQIGAVQTDLKKSEDNLSATQQSLQLSRENFSAAVTRGEAAESKLAAASQVMTSIAMIVPDSISKLQKVNSVLTNAGACPGGSSGVPLPHGSEMSTLSATVMSNLAAAKSAIEGLLPPK